MKSGRGFLITLYVWVMFASVLPASAEIYTGTGDYRQVQTDGGDNKSEGPKLIRYYHSVWNVSGMFGNGWLTDYDLVVEKRDNDTLALMEPCSGEKTVFSRSPEDVSAKSVQRVGGIIYKSGKCGCQKIEVTSTGYVHTFGNTTKVFDLQGKLLSLRDGTSYSIDVARDKQGAVSSLTDSRGVALVLSRNDKGQIQEIIRDGQPFLKYSYAKDGRLASVTTTSDVGYNYEYDAQGLMSHFKYGHMDESISYYGPDQQHKVMTHNDGLGYSDLYSYSKVSADGLTHSASITIMDNDEVLSHSEVTYFDKREKDGTVWLQKVVEKTDGEVTKETTYAKSSLPIEVKEYGETTRFEYDKLSRLIRKESPHKLVEYIYENKFGKVSIVRRSDPGLAGSLIETKYEYDSIGNLTKASDNDGSRVALTYDADNRIKTMNTEDATLSFLYNKRGKPVHIELAGVGAIDVTYDDSARITSTGGKNSLICSLKVSTVFQVLLNLIREAKQ